MVEAFICDAIRTPFARYAGTLSTARTDDLAALPLAARRDAIWLATAGAIARHYAAVGG